MISLKSTIYFKKIFYKAFICFPGNTDSSRNQNTDQIWSIMDWLGLTNLFDFWIYSWMIDGRININEDVRFHNSTDFQLITILIDV